MKRFNESLEAYESGIQNIGLHKGELSQTEELSGLWLGKGAVLSLWAGSIKDGQVWSLKADALKALGKSAEAQAAYARAKGLGYNG